MALPVEACSVAEATPFQPSSGHLGNQQLRKLNDFVAGLSHLLARVSSALWASGPWCMSISAALFSVSSLLVKLTGGRVPTLEIVCFRSSVSFLFCAVGAHKANIAPLFGHRPNLLYLLGRGMCGAAAMTSYYLCIAALPLADAVTLFFLNPAVTAVAARLILHEPLGLVGVGGVLLSVIGLVILSQPPFLFNATGVGWDHQRVLGTSFGVMSALFAAGAFICIRLIGKREPALVMSVYFHTCAFLTSAIPLAVGVPDRALWPAGIDILLLFGIACTSFWGQMLVGRGFQLLTAAKGSAINFTQVIYSYAFGILLLNEEISLWGLLGSGLIASGVLLVNLRRKPTQGQEQAAAEGAGLAAAVVEDGKSVGGAFRDAEGGEGRGALEAQPLLQPTHVSSSAEGLKGSPESPPVPASAADGFIPAAPAAESMPLEPAAAGSISAAPAAGLVRAALRPSVEQAGATVQLAVTTAGPDKPELESHRAASWKVGGPEEESHADDSQPTGSVREGKGVGSGSGMAQPGSLHAQGEDQEQHQHGVAVNRSRLLGLDSPRSRTQAVSLLQAVPEGEPRPVETMPQQGPISAAPQVLTAQAGHTGRVMRPTDEEQQSLLHAREGAGQAGRAHGTPLRACSGTWIPGSLRMG